MNRFGSLIRSKWDGWYSEKLEQFIRNRSTDEKNNGLGPAIVFKLLSSAPNQIRKKNDVDPMSSFHPITPYRNDKLKTNNEHLNPSSSRHIGKPKEDDVQDWMMIINRNGGKSIFNCLTKMDFALNVDSALHLNCNEIVQTFYY